MRKAAVLIFAGLIILQPPFGVSAENTGSAPLYNVTVVAGTTKAFNYQVLNGSTKIGFRGTVLFPEARGEAKVKNKGGTVTIEADFENLESATKFGAEYLTYVLWAISPAGRATNLGELVIDDEGESHLTVTTQP